MSQSIDIPASIVDQHAIRWLDDGPASSRPCTVCGSRGPHRGMLDVPSLSLPQRMLRLIRCSHCATAFYDPPDIRDFSDLGQNADEFWRFYVEVGGGVWETIWPLLMDVGAGAKSLLDIGCGFGFALDFWKRSANGNAEGIELADYGRRGAAMLDVDIHSELLEHCATLAGRRFDIVYASEVIEHVPDPRAFVKLLSRWVADDGVLVMTTPCAGFLTRENASPTLVAALAPGFHGFLLSQRAFEETARRAGFSFVEVRSYNERMVMWASRVSRTIAPAPEHGRAPYFAYLATRYAMEDSRSVVWQGYAYRYLRDLVNTGQLDVARRVATRLSDALVDVHGGDILKPQIVVPRLRAARDLSELGAVAPFFIANLYYLLACVAHRVQRNVGTARRLYDGAVAAIEASARLGPLFFLEALSLFWPARRAAALMALAAGDIDGGSKAFASIADDDLATLPRGVDPAPSIFVETSLPNVAEGLLTRGHATQAHRVADAYRRHVARVYGAPMLTVDGLGAAIDTACRLPANPFFVPWYDALVSPPSDAVDARLAAIVRVAERLRHDRRFTAQVRDLENRVKTLAATRHRTPLFSFETTYTHRQS